MENITVDQILERASCLERRNLEDKYNKSYYHFLAYFLDKDRITEHDLVIGANFVYGWMPTILNFKSNDFASAVSILNQLKSGTRISEDQLLILKGLVNNSVVGVSKLLHFISPNSYAIWDSRVCNFLTGKSHNQKVENIKRYSSYLDLCNRVAADQRLEEIHVNHQKRLGFAISPMRTIEQIMFINSNEPLRN